MIGSTAEQKRTFSIAITLIFALVFGCIAACIIAAAPREEAEPLMTAANEPQRITAPVDAPSSSLLDPAVTRELETEAVAPTTVLTHTDNIKADAPETESVSDTTAPETTAAPQTTAVTETTAAPETAKAPETTAAPETTKAPETTAAPEAIVPSGTDAFYVVPEIKSGFLADELGVAYTIMTPKVSVTEEELIYAATIIQLEVMGSGSSLYRFDDVTLKYWEMCAVAQCIRNRAESGRFPNSIYEVLFQSHTTPSGRVIYQFSPAKTLDLYTPTEEAIVAAREVLINGVSVLPSNYYYFCATRIVESFERNNAYIMVTKADGSFDKVQGHLTTFYAGHP